MQPEIFYTGWINLGIIGLWLQKVSPNVRFKFLGSCSLFQGRRGIYVMSGGSGAIKVVQGCKGGPR